MSDDYTSTPTRLRIVKQGPPEHAWMLDGYDEQNRCTEAALAFETFGEAVDAIPYFITEYAKNLA